MFCRVVELFKCQLSFSASYFSLKVGERQAVLITEDSKDGAHFVGHNKYYDQASELYIKRMSKNNSFCQHVVRCRDGAVV